MTEDQPRWTDNIALARFIQTELYAKNKAPFGLFADTEIDAHDADFERRGDMRSFITERVLSAVDGISLKAGMTTVAGLRQGRDSAADPEPSDLKGKVVDGTSRGSTSPARRMRLRTSPRPT